MFAGSFYFLFGHDSLRPERRLSRSLRRLHDIMAGYLLHIRGGAAEKHPAHNGDAVFSDIGCGNGGCECDFSLHISYGRDLLPLEEFCDVLRIYFALLRIGGRGTAGALQPYRDQTSDGEKNNLSAQRKLAWDISLPLSSAYLDQIRI